MSEWEKVGSFLLGDLLQVLAVVSSLLLELLVSRHKILLFLGSSLFQVLLFIVHLLAPLFGLLLVALVLLQAFVSFGFLFFLNLLEQRIFDIVEAGVVKGDSL